MAIPVWVPGQILSSSDVNSWLAPNGVIKQADQSVTSSSTPISDTELVLPVAASAQYMFQLFLDYEGGTLGSSDLRVLWGLPSGAFMRINAKYRDNVGNIHEDLVNDATTVICGSNGAGVLRSAEFTGTLIMGSTAGNMQLRWAQGTISGTATIVHAWSGLALQRMT